MLDPFTYAVGQLVGVTEPQLHLAKKQIDPLPDGVFSRDLRRGKVLESGPTLHADQLPNVPAKSITPFLQLINHDGLVWRDGDEGATSAGPNWDENPACEFNDLGRFGQILEPRREPCAVFQTLSRGLADGTKA